MQSELRFLGEFTIKDGHADEFRALLSPLIDSVRANEPDTLSYEFDFNDDDTKCFALERYRNSKAVLAHLKNVGQMASKLFELATLTRAELYGDASDELKKALAPFDTKFLKHWNGLTR